SPAPWRLDLWSRLAGRLVRRRGGPSRVPCRLRRHSRRISCPPTATCPADRRDGIARKIRPTRFTARETSSFHAAHTVGGPPSPRRAEVSAIPIPKLQRV